MFFLLNAPPAVLITKGQGSQTICNSISTDYNRNLTIIYVVMFQSMHVMLHSNGNLYTSIVYEKKTCHLNINKNKIVMKISYLCK